MLDEDNVGYFRFTRPQRLDKAIHTLEGMLKGVGADGDVSPQEIRVLHAWMDEHAEFARFHPFNEVFPVLSSALADGRLDHEEHEDLLWLCGRLTAQGEFFDAITHDMQRLHGLMAGVSFDGEITVEELRGLHDWIGEHEHLRACWPYDEIDALITSVLSDGEISREEHDELLTFFADFAHHAGQRAIGLPDAANVTVRGVCAVDPVILFPERRFCFTGKSQRVSRMELSKLVRKLGGHFSDNVTLDLDYLIIGADGNPCWAYACYGRKVEKAVGYRKAGHKLLLVHEFDFWDRVRDSD